MTEETKDVHSLPRGRSFINEKPSSYYFEGREVKVKDWVEFAQEICSKLYVKDPDKFRSFLTDPDFEGGYRRGRLKKRKYLSSDKLELDQPENVSDAIYLEGKLNTDHILDKIISPVLKKFDIEESEVKFRLVSRRKFLLT